ncbi:nucleotidyl transferase AbiEii/AbiGii toxin family protein [Acidobacteriota bacterium]
MTINNKNISASVHQRLLNKAMEASRPFNELLQHFAIERFLYRLSKSPHSNKFILKGALMFSVWGGSVSRLTKDIDFLGNIDNSPDVIVAAMKDVCITKVEADGVDFNSETVTTDRITEGADYEGVRVRIQGSLGNARVAIQVDIGFGDLVVPHPKQIIYPRLLDFPSPELSGYSMESTIAEKFHAMVNLGVLNSRMKDFYDIWMLSRVFDFSGKIQAEAIKTTFDNRKTPIIVNPVVFNSSFSKEMDKIGQWKGFISKAKLSNVPEDFMNVVAQIKMFIEPLVAALSEEQGFRGTWKAPGPWQ